MNQEIRQLALRGEYLPDGGPYYAIHPTSGNYEGSSTGNVDYYKRQRRLGIVFFPDEQTRTEYLQVGEGTWLPKEGDELVCIRRESLEDNCIFSVAIIDFKPDTNFYFPSAEQRASFIAKRKGETWTPGGDTVRTATDGTNTVVLKPSDDGYDAKEALKRKGEEPKEQTVTIDGDTIRTPDGEFKITDRHKVKLEMKTVTIEPQIISICISDEAMIKVADRINLLVQEDWTAEYSRSVVDAVVSGLHLESTLIGGAQ